MASLYERLEDARKDNDKPMQAYIKRLIVSLPGKFGETGKQWRPSPSEPQFGPWASWKTLHEDGIERRYRNVAWHTQVEEISAESETSMPAIAAFITSYARVRMLHMMRVAGRENVFYTDTDSLITNENGYNNLLGSGSIDDTMPGYFRVLDTAEDTKILGIKHYRHSGKWTCAGVPRSTANDREGSQGYWQSARGIDSCRTGDQPSTRQQLISFNRDSVYLHGRVQEDGSIRPWEFNYDE
jgi:hypothetical protein